MSQTLLVIGGASLDVLHFRGRTVRSAGGAGLYTALAARRAGARVTMVGPRPEPMPPELIHAAERLDWRGPTVAPERLPSFEIAHLGGGRTELRGARWRAEAELDAASLPDALPRKLVYCIPLTDPRRQLELVRHFSRRGSTVACGTYSGAVTRSPEVVRQVLEAADVFFCNEAEAAGLFGDVEAARTEVGKLLFVTRGARGARVVQGRDATDVAAVAVRELDPTGAGDAFCGTVLALLAGGAHPLAAARRAVAVAAEVVTGVGPEALLRPPPAPAEAQVHVDGERLARIAELLGALPEVAPFSFTGGDFPPPGHPGALDYFFAATLQQFGFWTAEAGRYRRPAAARLGGRMLKGSDYLWAAYRRWLDSDPAGLTPAGQRDLDAGSLARRLASDDGEALPAPELRLAQARSYGRDLTTLGLQPADAVARANAARRPLASLFAQLDHLGGYKEDPLRKKSGLLALILRQRPERFLRIEPAEAMPPVVDYHVQRSCLRMGLVRVEDRDLHRRLSARELLGEDDERRLREACFEAMAALARASGRSMGAVDWFFFQNRRRCPEMSEPECGRCEVEPACARHKTLFQPVRRTSFY